MHWEELIRWDEVDLHYRTPTGRSVKMPGFNITCQEIGIDELGNTSTDEIHAALESANRFSDSMNLPLGLGSPRIGTFQRLPREFRVFSSHWERKGSSVTDILTPQVGMDYYSIEEGVLTVTLWAVILVEFPNAESLTHYGSRLAAALGLPSITAAEDHDFETYQAAHLKIHLSGDFSATRIADLSRAIRTLAYEGSFDALGRTGLIASIRMSSGISLLALPESEVFDAKRDNYAVKTRLGKHRLATDIAAFANSQDGGLLIIGAVTARNDNGQDAVIDIPGVEPAYAPRMQQLIDLTREYIYPSVEGLDLIEIPTARSPLYLIDIPPQNEAAKPFLVRGVLVDPAAGNRAVVEGVSLAIRRADRNENLELSEFHSLIRDSINRRSSRPTIGDV